jgi:hypothetical protein
MVERGRKALDAELKRQADRVHGFYQGDGGTYDGEIDLVALFRAAIASLRGPTDKIAEILSERDALGCWYAAIDEALR